jgi:ATP-dependent HslUV protease, peptidase subunit HslV
MISLWSPLKLARIPLRSCPALYHSSVPSRLEQYHGTTIICIRKNGKVCMMGDGQVSAGSTIVKPNAIKLRVIGGRSTSSSDYDGGGDDDGDENNNHQEDMTKTLVGFAGSTADAFTLVDRLEGKLEEYPGQLVRSAVELAKGWRTDRYLRRLEASLLVADSKCLLEVTGNGDVLESNDGILGVGSGSSFAIGTYVYNS